MTESDTTEDDETRNIDDMWENLDTPDVELPDATTEDGTERDGVLSYSGEWHALFMGIGAGLTANAAVVSLFLTYVFGRTHLLGTLYGEAKAKLLSDTDHLSDAADEPAYSVFGVLFGLFLNGWLIGYKLALPVV